MAGGDIWLARDQRRGAGPELPAPCEHTGIRQFSKDGDGLAAGSRVHVQRRSFGEAGSERRGPGRRIANIGVFRMARLVRPIETSTPFGPGAASLICTNRPEYYWEKK